MALYLVQHGKCLSANVGSERSLSTEGQLEIEYVATIAQNHNIVINRIEHSGKRRSEQTAHLFASYLNPPDGVHSRDGIKPLDDVIPIARKLDPDQQLMLVGHLPFMERLASYLITGIAEKPIIRFVNGGLVCLDKQPETRNWVIKWIIVPSSN